MKNPCPIRGTGILYCVRQVLAVVMIDADHDGRCLDDGVCLLADLEAELFDGIHADRRGNHVAALELDVDDAVDSTLLDGDDFALKLISCTKFHIVSSFFDSPRIITQKHRIVYDLYHNNTVFCVFRKH